MVEADNLVGNQEPNSWPRYNLQQLETAINNARSAGKYLFIWDKQGNVGTFMQYKGKLASLGPEILKIALQRSTPADVGEVIRKQFVDGMRNGENLCLDLEKANADFVSYKVDGTFDPDIFFDWERMNTEANYMAYVRQDENHGIGGINPGCGYTRAQAFHMSMRTDLETDQEVKDLVERIPLFNSQFHHVIFE